MRSLSPWVIPGESTEHQAILNQNAKMAPIHTSMDTAKATRGQWQMCENDRERKHWTRLLISYGKSYRPYLQISSVKYKRCAWPRDISTSCVRFWVTTRSTQALQRAAVSSHMNALAMLSVCGGWREPGFSINNGEILLPTHRRLNWNKRRLQWTQHVYCCELAQSKTKLHVAQVKACPTPWIYNITSLHGKDSE